MIRRIFIAGAFVLLTGCGAPIPEGVETYCPDCYREIQHGQAFVPAGDEAPDDSEGGAAR